MPYDPYEHAAQLNVDVQIGRDDLLEQRNAAGLWLPRRQMILLRSDLGATVERCVLAHELAHCVMGHHDSRPKHEVLADRYAAEQLVDRARLIRLMVERPGHYAAWSNDLAVTTKIMRVYLNVHRLDLARERHEPYRVHPMVLNALG